MRSLAGLWDGRLRLVVVIYVALYVLLDWVSLIDRSSPLGITPWNPPAGLSFALLLRFGFGFAPAVFAAVVLSDLLFRDVRASPLALGAAAAVIAGGYTAAAAILRRNVRLSMTLDRRNDLIALLGVATGAATLIAPVVIAIFCAGGLLAWSDFTELALHFWVGDVLGIVVLAPFLLLVFAEGRRWPALIRPGSALTYGLQVAAIGLGLWIIFGLESANHFEFSYVLFLPLIWIALRDGLIGAAWGIVATQIGVIVALQVKGFDTETVAQFQFLMLAVAVTGFFLGGVVDERQRAESNLRDSEARLQTVVSTAPDAILTYEEDGRIASANRAAAALFGGGQRALTGTPLQRVLPQIASGAEIPAGTETTAQRTDGAAFTAEVSVGRADLAGRTLHVAVVRDITERKQAEAALQQHEAQLAQASRLAAAGAMAAGIAHELNQPLTAAISFARACEEVLKAPPEKLPEVRPEASALIGEAVQQALRAGEIMRQTREMLRRGDVQPRRVGVAQLFKTTLDLMRSEIALHRVAVATEVAPGVAPVFADPIQIQQVLLNLLRNSIEEMARAGSAARRIALAARPAEIAGMVEFAVSDTGPGIRPEIAGRLFTPFATTKESGMGLGLSVSRSIIDGHGGEIWAVKKEPGSGAEIRFTLPAYAESDEGGDEA
jgi:two-component system sensor kinase FixL